MTKGLLRFGIAALLGSRLFAQTPAAPAPAAGAVAPADAATYLKITINPSRTPIALDTAAGLSAEIKNVGRLPVVLRETETVFVLVPELKIYETTKVRGCGSFPTFGNGSNGVRPPGGYELTLQPGESYLVPWDVRKDGCNDTASTEGIGDLFTPNYWKDRWQRLLFTPGKYQVSLDILFHTSDGTPYHTAEDGKEVLVSAPQQLILFGAWLGGFLAYVIKLYYDVPTKLTAAASGRLQWWLGKTEWFVAGLFAAILVVLASRLDDAFPIKVNVSDFWGAITMGFVFQWGGVSLLEKLPGLSGKPAVTQGPSTPPKDPGPVVTDVPVKAVVISPDAGVAVPPKE